MYSVDTLTINNLRRRTIEAHSVNNHNEYSFMILNKDKPVHIILEYSNAGFWSIFNKLMNYLIYYKDIRKIDFNVVYPPNTRYTFYGNDNYFSKIFEPYNIETSDELLKINAKNYITYEATGCYANWIHVSDNSWRKQYHNIFNKYIKIRPEILSELSTYDIPATRKKISLLIRHPALSHEQINSRMPTFNQYDSIIETLLQKYNNDCIFILATDLLEAEQHFKSKYSNYTIIHPFSVKTSTKSSEAQHTLYTGSTDLAKIAVQTVLLLAMGDDFIFPNSNMATAALYINPNMTAHYLIG